MTTTLLPFYEIVKNHKVRNYNNWVATFKVHKLIKKNQQHHYMNLDKAYFFTCLEMFIDFTPPVERYKTFERFVNENRIFAQMMQEIEKELEERFSHEDFPSLDICWQQLYDRILM